MISFCIGILIIQCLEKAVKSKKSTGCPQLGFFDVSLCRSGGIKIYKRFVYLRLQSYFNQKKYLNEAISFLRSRNVISTDTLLAIAMVRVRISTNRCARIRENQLTKLAIFCVTLSQLDALLYLQIVGFVFVFLRNAGSKIIEA